MPLHQFYHAPGVFSDQQKSDLANAITKLYMGFGLPAFYVVVVFKELKTSEFFVGGKPAEKFVRVCVQHIARQFESNATLNVWFEAYGTVLAPFIKERGLDWEIAIEQVDRDMWRLNGLVPPLSETPAEQQWVREDKAVPYDEADNLGYRISRKMKNN